MSKLSFCWLLFILSFYESRALAADMAEDYERAIPILTKTMVLSPYDGPVPAKGILEIPALDLVVAFENIDRTCKLYLYNFTEEKFIGTFDLHGLVVAVSSERQEIVFKVKGPYRTERVACVVVRQTQLLNEDEEYVVTEIAHYLSRHIKRSANPQILLDKDTYRVVQNMPEPARSIVSKLVDKETGLRRVMSCIF